MRQFAVLVGMALLNACGGSVESEHPLFRAGIFGLKLGLWAAVPIDKSCELPKDAAIFGWPDCAAPILIQDGTATYFKPSPVSVRFILSEGTPRIVQSETDILDGITGPDATRPPPPGHRFYASFSPDGPGPLDAGKLQFLLCPSGEIEPKEGSAAKDKAARKPGAIPGLAA